MPLLSVRDCFEVIIMDKATNSIDTSVSYWCCCVQFLDLILIFITHFLFKLTVINVVKLAAVVVRSAMRLIMWYVS